MNKVERMEQAVKAADAAAAVATQDPDTAWDDAFVKSINESKKQSEVSQDNA
jgi:hypothetical protein|tara:strand:- start:11912 stop:12067 length:156 start_codon:yes stop_codon:yes gene_type:complete